MPGYITLGANDLPASGRFYTAILPPLGYTKSESADGIAFTSPTPTNGPGAIYVKPPFDGQPATAGNGAMIALEAATHETVRTLHTAALEAGGTNEGNPGFRDAYSDNFYVAYLRDPTGNKIALFCANPAEPSRRR